MPNALTASSGEGIGEAAQTLISQSHSPIKRRSVDGPLPDVASPLLARVYAARGATSSEALDYQLKHLPHFSVLAEIDAAVDLLSDAVVHDHRIAVVGDFDADGATSTALARHALGAMGASRVAYRLPHRVHDGYGLSAGIVDALGDAGPGDMIVTVDNGISSFAGVRAAKARGWRVVVLDHHLPGPERPAADAIVNPNQPHGGGQLGELAGVGVTFYVMLALRSRLAKRGRGACLPRMSDYLDLVAIGTVADCVPMRRVNRALVAQGIRRIRAGRNRPGVTALLAAAGRPPKTLAASDIGFGIAPRINAAGRLDDMTVGVGCLLATSPSVARERANQLDTLNAQRRQTQNKMQAQADEAALDSPPAPGEDRPATQVVYRRDWHEGVVGLVAGRLAREWHRPAVAFAPSASGMAKGSARSIAGINVRDALAAVDANQPDLIDRFGGHAGAAGLTVAIDRIEQFREAFDDVIKAALTPAIATPAWITDGELGPNELSLESAIELRDGGPWGPGFEAPVFDGVFECLDARIVGDRHIKLRLANPHSMARLDAIWFNGNPDIMNASRLTLVYQPDVNHYNNRQQLQLVVLDAWGQGTGIRKE